jgi:multidrug efflux pump subunit AcrA (membrane-fusion protein)
MITELEPNIAETLPPPDTQEPRKFARAAGIVALFAVLTILAVIGFGLRARRAAAKALVNAAQSAVSARVSVVHPQANSNSEELILPGNIQAFVEAPIYARTHGYLKNWYFDIGAYVRQGQLLAEIETPEEDQQLAQARADLKSAQANMNLAETTAVRWQNLLKRMPCPNKRPIKP